MDQRQRKLRSELDNQFRVADPLPVTTWEGFRKFKVHKIVPEDEKASSVYLTAEDQKPLPLFNPGQHLTFRFQVPGKSKPVVRCYSLSDSPNPDYYRITVKRCPPPRNKPDAPRGLVSHYVNEQLSVGEILDVKAPNGSFFLKTDQQNSVILLAGGIGITPMMSMINTLIQSDCKRHILLVYGVNNSTQHTFKNQLREYDAQNENLKVLTIYSDPLPTDQPGVDFDLTGYVDASILQPILSNSSLEYYMCGPPPFMSGLYNGLIENGVQEENIHFEAFGPASIKRVSEAESQSTEENAESVEIEFCKSGAKLNWSNEFENILEMAEANDIELESGCRAGNCGTCELALLEGTVRHPEHVKVASGKCLACVAKPKSNLKLEA